MILLFCDLCPSTSYNLTKSFSFGFLCCWNLPNSLTFITAFRYLGGLVASDSSPVVSYEKIAKHEGRWVRFSASFPSFSGPFLWEMNGDWSAVADLCAGFQIERPRFQPKNPSITLTRLDPARIDTSTKSMFFQNKKQTNQQQRRSHLSFTSLRPGTNLMGQGDLYKP